MNNPATRTLTRPRSLTARQRLFVQEYMIDHNATNAAARAGYSGKTSGVLGYQLLQIPLVRQAVAECHALRAKRMEVTADKVVAELSKIAFADLGEVLRIEGGRVYIKNTAELTPGQRASISQVSETQHGITVKQHSKTQALDLLSKYLGLYSERQLGDVDGLGAGGRFEIVIVEPAPQSQTQEYQEAVPVEYEETQNDGNSND